MPRHLTGPMRGSHNDLRLHRGAQRAVDDAPMARRGAPRARIGAGPVGEERSLCSAPPYRVNGAFILGLASALQLERRHGHNRHRVA